MGCGASSGAYSPPGEEAERTRATSDGKSTEPVSRVSFSAEPGPKINGHANFGRAQTTALGPPDRRSDPPLDSNSPSQAAGSGRKAPVRPGAMRPRSHSHDGGSLQTSRASSALGSSVEGGAPSAASTNGSESGSMKRIRRSRAMSSVEHTENATIRFTSSRDETRLTSIPFPVRTLLSRVPYPSVPSSQTRDAALCMHALPCQQPA